MDRLYPCRGHSVFRSVQVLLSHYNSSHRRSLFYAKIIGCHFMPGQPTADTGGGVGAAVDVSLCATLNAELFVRLYH